MCQVQFLLLRSALGGDGGFVGGGEVYLGLYDIMFPVVRHNIDMPWFKNKKRARSVDGFRCCSSFSAC